MIRHLLVAAGIVLSLAGCGQHPDASGPCMAKPVTQVPLVGLSNNWTLVHVQLNGQPVQLLIDTGATFSVLTEPAATRLGLERTPVKIRRLVGVGGFSSRLAAIAGHMRMGDLTRDDQRFEVVDTVFGNTQVAIDGVLGMDVLDEYDTELDLRRSRMTLYAGGSCDGRPPDMAAATRVPVSNPFPATHLMTVPLRLDGRQFSALLDSGAFRSMVGAAAAQHVGVTAAQAGDQAIALHGVGDDRPSAFLHRFQELAIGSNRVRNPHLLVGPVESNYDLILGADVLRFFRLWIPADAGAIWFQLDVKPAQ